MKPFAFNEKVALVTGSAQGIGKAIAIELGRRNAKVMLNDLNRKKLFYVRDELRAMGISVDAITADVRHPRQCANLIRRTLNSYGSLDILVNNAGVSCRGSVEEMADSVFSTVVDTNYTGAAYLSKYAVPMLKKSKGHLIFINSVGGFRGMPYNSAYTASKMAQFALAQALQIELKDDQVHVGIVFVGFTENDPEKKILDVDGSWIFLPKRDNVYLAKPKSVARSVCHLIEKRQFQMTLTPLGHLTGFLNRYFPGLASWIIAVNHRKIRDEFTLIGGVSANDSPTTDKVKRDIVLMDQH